MSTGPAPPRDPNGLPRRTRELWSDVARAAALVGGFVSTCFLCGAPAGVLLIGTAVLLVAMLLERRHSRRRIEAASRRSAIAARAAGEREALAQAMSLELAYERSRSVLESLGEGVLVADGGGEIVLANPAARRALRATAQDPVGRLLWEALTPALASRARDAFDALRSGARGTEPVRFAAVPCRERVFDLTAVRATSRRTGQDFGTVFLLVDSTRAHELQRLKERFLSSVSHELRTPLTNICAYSEILRHMLPGESAEWPEFVRVIHEEGLQLSHLVDAMFDYLQLESGEMPFRREVVDGAAIVRQVVEACRHAAEERGVQLNVVFGDDVPEVLADPSRLQQVVDNLLDNAIKFTPAGGAVELRVEDRHGNWQLRVDDSGSGVPESERQTVFEKFNQLSDHMTDKPAGTGLGLASSRAIVARFGGLIWCEGSPLGGAAFVVLLPAVGQPQLLMSEPAGL